MFSIPVGIMTEAVQTTLQNVAEDEKQLKKLLKIDKGSALSEPNNVGAVDGLSQLKPAATSAPSKAGVVDAPSPPWQPAAAPIVEAAAGVVADGITTMPSLPTAS